jgi:predicted SAM-dependent methyltransferase
MASRLLHNRGFMSNLVVGAKETSFPGWMSTDLRQPGSRLDVRRAEDWSRSFAVNSIDRIVAEHMLEHLTLEDGLIALCNIRRHLKPGGHVRIGVPDAYNPDPAYQEHCRPGGKGQAWARLFLYQADEPEHKTHYNYKSLSALMLRAGLTPRLLEHHDEQGVFHRGQWKLEDGPVQRYYNSPYNLNVYLPFHGFQNLSLIIDGVKPSSVSDAVAIADSCEVALSQRASVVDRPVGKDSTGNLLLFGALALGAILVVSYAAYE